MTLEQTQEIIEYFNSVVLPRLPKGLVEHIAAVPIDSQERVDYMHQHWVANYDTNYLNSIEDEDLTVGVYYYEKQIIHNAPLCSKWLNMHDINNFPTRFTEILDQYL